MQLLKLVFGINIAENKKQKIVTGISDYFFIQSKKKITG